VEDITAKNTLCPSARVESENSVVFGVIVGTETSPRLAYLKEPIPITDELIAKASPVTPTEVFRMATPCATNRCLNFDGKDCRLAKQIVEKLPVVVEELPPCSIRRDCRWWMQGGKAACMRCPQVITDSYNASEVIQDIAQHAAGLVK
jgi:hypothetical protein